MRHLSCSATNTTHNLLCVWAALTILAPSPAHADDAAAALDDVGASSSEAEAEDEDEDATGLAASEPPPCESGDMDSDGVCDDIEAATGTKLLRADTDADGVPDGVEDTNRDGIVDPGESDPRVPGLFPGTYPHIPEPMVFDLVRGLGAKQGEVEVNTLAVLNLRRGHQGLSWAPEVEWAFADGLAVEVELPLNDRELEALKGAFQATFPTKRENMTHGVQLIGEYLLDTRDTMMSALYLVGGRAGKWSMFAMLGARAVTPMDARVHYEGLINPGVYNDVTEKLTVGLESNIALGLAGDHMLAIIPQVHWQVSRRVRLQVGGGARLEGRNLHPLVATRIILE